MSYLAGYLILLVAAVLLAFGLCKSAKDGDNAAAELRAKGFDVRCDKNGSNPTYTLGEATVGSAEASSPAAERPAQPVAVATPSPVASPNVSQLTLEEAA